MSERRQEAGVASRGGLADPADARSNCGVGVVMDLDGGSDHGTVSVTATLRNDADVLAVSNLTLSRDGNAVEARRAVLVPDSDRTVTYEEIALDPGTYTFAVGNRSTTVRIADTTTPTAEGDGPGFTAVATLSALAVLVVVARKKRR
jgi:hypothetical protein